MKAYEKYQKNYNIKIKIVNVFLIPRLFKTHKTLLTSPSHYTLSLASTLLGAKKELCYNKHIFK